MASQSDLERFSGPSGSLPEEVRSAFLDILYDTLLLIRGHSTLSDLCSVLANHAHNLPGFLRRPCPALLRFYWETERPCFLQNMEARGFKVSMFEEAWAAIAQEYEKLGKS